MNVRTENVNNLLFVPQSSAYVEEMYTFWLQCITKDQTVVVLAVEGSEPSLLPLLEKLGMDMVTHKEHLKRLIIMYFSSIEAVVNKLLELHEWALRPNIIVVDLIGFIKKPTQVPLPMMPKASMPLLRTVCRCIAVLFNLMNALGRQALQLKSTVPQKEATPAMSTSSDMENLYSVVLLQPHLEELTATQLELITALYYYNKSACEVFKQVADKIRVSEDKQMPA